MICNIKRRPAGGIKVGTLAVGEIVQIAVSGVMTNFIVANQGIPADTGTGYDGSYDASCDGTWMIAEALMDGPRVSGLQMWSDNLTSWFSAMIDEKVMNTIRQATYPSFYPNAYLVTAKITRPSVRELNFLWTYKGSTYDGAPLEYFLTHSAIMPWTGSSTEADYWTRSKSPRDSSSEAVYVSNSGVASQRASHSNARARPLFIFEPDTLVKKVSDGVYQLA